MTDNNRTRGTVSIWPTVWKWTLILAAFKSVYSLILWMTGLISASGVSVLGLVVSIVLVVLGLRNFRTLNNGYMTFGQGFGIGYVASVLSAAVGSAVQAVYLATLGADALAAQTEAVLAQFRANPGMDRQTLDTLTGLFGAIYTPAGVFISGICAAAIGWAIVCPIIAAAVKKPPPLAD